MYFRPVRRDRGLDARMAGCVPEKAPSDEEDLPSMQEARQRTRRALPALRLLLPREELAVGRWTGARRGLPARADGGPHDHHRRKIDAPGGRCSRNGARRRAVLLPSTMTDP